MSDENLNDLVDGTEDDSIRVDGLDDLDFPQDSTSENDSNQTDDNNNTTNENGMRTITLGDEKFRKFTSILSTLSRVCTDLSIKNSKIAQRSDIRNSIYLSDVSSIFGEDVELLVSGIQSKVDILEPFKKQQASVVLVSDDVSYSFYDDYSRIKFIKPMEKYINNEFIQEDEISRMLSIPEGGEILQHEIGKFILDRLSGISKGLAANMIMVVFEGTKAKFKITASDNTSSTIGTIFSVDLQREFTGIAAFPITPFLMSSGDIKISCYLRGDDRENILLKLELAIEEVPMEIWCISKISTDS